MIYKPRLRLPVHYLGISSSLQSRKTSLNILHNDTQAMNEDLFWSLEFDVIGRNTLPLETDVESSSIVKDIGGD